MSALIVTHSDIGRHLFTKPDLDAIREGVEIDTEVVILLDSKTSAIGYVYIRGPMQCNGDDGCVFGNFRKVTVLTIADNCKEFFETQEEAIRAALDSEREYANGVLLECHKLEQKLGLKNE